MRIYLISLLLIATSLNAFYFEVPEDHIGFKLSLPSFETSGSTTERFNKFDIYFTVSEQNLQSDKSLWDSGASPFDWTPEYATYYGNELRWENFAIDVDVNFKDGSSFVGSITENINVWSPSGGGPEYYMIWLDNNSDLEDVSESLISYTDLSISNLYSFDSFLSLSISSIDYTVSFLGLPHFNIYDNHNSVDGVDWIYNSYGHEKAYISAVPEPSTYALILGAVALGFTIRRGK